MDQSVKTISYYKEQLDSLKDMFQRTNEYLSKIQDELKEAKAELQVKHQEILKSVDYAEGIQKRILPSKPAFKNFFSNSAFYIKQQSVIGGDLIYARERDGQLYFALMDCTGHGIPGALISMMGFSFLDEIVKFGRNKNPSEIMDLLNQHFVDFFKSTENEPPRQDGMDGIFCAFNPRSNLLTYCTAGRPLWIKQNNNWEYIKSNRLSIGGNYGKKFEAQEIKLNFGDELFLFSDGLPDQFGGEKDKKFMAKRVKKYLLDNNELSLEDKIKGLSREVNKWKNNNNQTDDISFLGLKL